ncbi:hypothetical protein AAV98_15545 [Bacillus sp. CHD6a]|nr:hypothetical protein AAV98_15545 [Bacillus sp. CHD6a]
MLQSTAIDCYDETLLLFEFTQVHSLHKPLGKCSSQVDCSGRRVDARGRKGQVRPRNGVRRLTDRQQASEAPGTEINSYQNFSQKKTKASY